MARSSPRAGRPIEERAFHEWLVRALPAGRSGLLPLGDDAAALAPPPGRVAVLTTDALVEGTHFLPDSPPEWIGRAAAAVSLSDCASKGASPAALLLDLLLPARSDESWARAVARGADRMGRRFGAPLVGGDTKPSATRAVVSTVLGWGRRGALAPRRGARAGDRLVTTGTVGRGGLAADRWARARGSPAARPRALRAMLDVRPRVREGLALAPYAHAMLDTSDGIADATQLLSRASRVRVVVAERLVPLEPGLASLPVTERSKAIVYGGDYELLAAVPRRLLGRAQAAVRRAGGRLSEIGWVEPGRGNWIQYGDSRDPALREPMPPGGWRPFGPDGDPDP